MIVQDYIVQRTFIERVKPENSTFREHFEERTKFLADILIARGYKRGFLQKQFCRAVNKYISEFQKWALPLDISAWFLQIV